MAGPNSAPNGDARLVKGYRHEVFVLVERSIADLGIVIVPVPLRDYLAVRKQLRTGKT